ncbi:type II secretion system protein [Hydrogenimonas sp.]
MRQGFSFIELLVSIVVIGIVFMSIPLILTETEKSNTFSIRQEAIMAGTTGIVNILGYRWDEADTNQTLNGGFAKVCDVTNGAVDLNRSDINRRIGHFKGEYRRKFFDYTYLATPDPQGIRPGITFATPPANLGSEVADGGQPDDIDDFNGANSSVTGGATQDYKLDYTISSSVYYISDAFNYTGSPTPLAWAIPNSDAGQMTNIKMVEINVTAAGESVVLHAFSSNIGEYKILHRTY